MYYRGAHFDVNAKKATHPEFTCYAESRDGIAWEKPKLGLFEFNGLKENNIVWAGDDTHNFTPFKDANPDCAADARYKALGGASLRSGGKGLRAYKSPDGIHWSFMREDAVITNGDFDSQNLAFWHPEQKRYLDFHRKGRAGVRNIMTSSSTDFLNWTEPAFLEYGDASEEHLYTNAIQPYFRAPHLFLGLPTRFQPKHEQVEPILMTSRDGRSFKRWTSRWSISAQGPDGNRSNYMTWGCHLPGKTAAVGLRHRGLLRRSEAACGDSRFAPMASCRCMPAGDRRNGHSPCVSPARNWLSTMRPVLEEAARGIQDAAGRRSRLALADCRSRPATRSNRP
jgi:hypothetical protein